MYNQEQIKSELNNLAEAEGISIEGKNSVELLSDIENHYKENNRWCNVYILKSEPNFYKIGVAWNVEHRLKHIQVANPLKTTILYARAFEYPYATEKALHIKYKDKNIRGEWYQFTDKEAKELIEYIAHL